MPTDVSTSTMLRMPQRTTDRVPFLILIAAVLSATFMAIVAICMQMRMRDEEEERLQQLNDQILNVFDAEEELPWCRPTQPDPPPYDVVFPNGPDRARLCSNVTREIPAAQLPQAISSQSSTHGSLSSYNTAMERVNSSPSTESTQYLTTLTSLATEHSTPTMSPGDAVKSLRDETTQASSLHSENTRNSDSWQTTAPTQDATKTLSVQRTTEAEDTETPLSICAYSLPSEAMSTSSVF